jgi:hypothetical protein
MPTWTIVGHAIVSADDRIADVEGRMPQALRNDADWALFQADLDRAQLTVLGRLGHEAHANVRRRPRMVVSSGATGLERRSDAWWWNPADLAWREAVAAVLPLGGMVAVPGGQAVFDLFLREGYDVFALSRAERVLIPDGRVLFSGIAEGSSGEALLRAGGLFPGDARVIDEDAGVTHTVWRRAEA